MEDTRDRLIAKNLARTVEMLLERLEEKDEEIKLLKKQIKELTDKPGLSNDAPEGAGGGFLPQRSMTTGRRPSYGDGAAAAAAGGGPPVARSMSSHGGVTYNGIPALSASPNGEMVYWKEGPPGIYTLTSYTDSDEEQ